MCVKSISTPSHIFAMVICLGNMTWLFAVEICRSYLPWFFGVGICYFPWEFGVAICRGNLPQLFAAAICGGFVLCVCKQTFFFCESKSFFLCKQTFFQWKQTCFYMRPKLFLLLRISFWQCFFLLPWQLWAILHTLVDAPITLNIWEIRRYKTINKTFIWSFKS